EEDEDGEEEEEDEDGEAEEEDEDGEVEEEDDDGTVEEGDEDGTTTGDVDLRKRVARRRQNRRGEDDAPTFSALSSAVFSRPTFARPIDPSGVMTCVCGPSVATPTATSGLPSVGIPTQFSSSFAVPSSSFVFSDSTATVTASETFSVPTDPISSSIADF
ncbi:hypothetical protein WG66_012772, partial [Moniliophthora roreri]